MRDRYLGLLMTVAVAVAAVDAVASLAMAQAPQIVRPPARIEGKPNFSGIWQANNEANWDLRSGRKSRERRRDMVREPCPRQSTS
jgi:hypothetical protein